MSFTAPTMVDEEGVRVEMSPLLEEGDAHFDAGLHCRVYPDAERQVDCRRPDPLWCDMMCMMSDS